MLFNHIKIAFRNLWRNRTFTGINMLGLALGFAVFLLLAQYVAFEWSANRFHQNADRLYRLSYLYKDGKSSYYMPPGLGPAIKSNVAGIEQCIRIGEGVGNGVVTVNGPSGVKAFREDEVSFTDDGFFKTFSFPVVQGNGSLSQPQTAALSAGAAKKYFGDEAAVGKQLKVTNQFGATTYTVTTVFQDAPANSDIRASILLSYSTLQSAGARNGNDWADPNALGSEYAFIYVLRQANANAGNVSTQATRLLHRLIPDAKTNQMGFQPMASLHIAPGFDYPYQTYGSLVLVTAFISVAVLIILIAWINYINLSTAQALNRIKEVGVRKVLGATRWQLTGQYITETVLLTVVSFAIALVAVVLLQPLYNGITGKQLSLAVLNAGWFWPAIAALMVAGTLLAGGYVAWVISSYNPARAIARKEVLTMGGLTLRKSLVVFQFIISMVFITATLVLYRQLQFMQHHDLGMAVSGRVVITGPSVINSSQIDNSVAFENEAKQLPFVKQVAASNNIPGQGYNFMTAGITGEQAYPGDEKKSYAMLIVDDQYFKTFDINFKYGNGFTPAMLEHGWPKTKRVILNEAAMKQLGYRDEASIIGKKIKWNIDFEVVGVVKDYHHLSLHEQIKPMIFLPAVADGYFTFKVDAGNIQAKIARLQSLYQKYFPAEPFTYLFLDDVYDNQYRAERQLGHIFIGAAGTAVLIACLGLLGLAMFAARQRVKEIGIRKVLGANVVDLVNLISFDFLKLVLLALLIATPIAVVMMNKWLQSFAYRTAMPWWLVGLGGVLAFGIAYGTVALQAYKAAGANPIKSLRND